MNGIQNGEKDPTLETKNQEPEKEITLIAPTFGFTERGTFFLEIHQNAGFLAIIGFVTKAVLWLNEKMEEYEAQKRAQKIVQPKKNMLGKFNLFK